MDNELLFKDEVRNMDELVEALDNANKLSVLDRVKIGVICFIFDKEGRLILNRRGPGARDDIGLLQALGGSVNGTDMDFRDAMLRELKEEAGLNANNIQLDAFLGAYLDGKIDHHTGDFVNWIILGYRGTLVSGEVKNMEPDRCVGIEKFELDKVPFNEVGTTATKFIKMLQGK